jgi:hypothetical protein
MDRLMTRVVVNERAWSALSLFMRRRGGASLVEGATDQRPHSRDRHRTLSRCTSEQFRSTRHEATQAKGIEVGSTEEGRT